MMEAKQALLDLTAFHPVIQRSRVGIWTGKVTRITGLLVETKGPPCALGEICEIRLSHEEGSVMAEVVGFKDENLFLMPFDRLEGIRPGSKVIATGCHLETGLGQSLKGRTIDIFGSPMDGLGPVTFSEKKVIHRKPPHPFARKRIDSIFETGIKAVDAFLTMGQGQRIGIFSGPGVGKSTLLGMMARNSCADVNVVALIGERGREVREFIERDLGEEGMKKSVVLVVTSDAPPVMRIKGAYVAMTIAEYFRDCGQNVLFMMDSLTRFAMAKRELGLSLGEPPTTKGYPPSVFSEMPILLERAGNSDKGSITGVYTVLVEADDFNEPVSDMARSILDGHIILNRKIAERNIYPAVDVLESVSRLSNEVCKPEHWQWIGKIKRLMAAYEEAKELIQIGAYVAGSQKDVDESLAKREALLALMNQMPGDKIKMERTLELMKSIALS